MQMIALSQSELEKITVGEMITVAAVMAILTAAVMAVVLCKLWFSNKGSATVPGGWKFTWN